MNAKLINENKCLSKGTVQSNSKYFFMKDEGKLIQKLEELEKIKENHMKALYNKEDIIESNLAEIENLKKENTNLLNKVQALERDINSAPSINDLHVLHNKIAKLEKDNTLLQKENNNLENEMMLLKNNTNMHIKNHNTSMNTSKDLNIGFKNSEDFTFEYDDSSASVILNKILQILNIQNTIGNAKIIETVQKIEKVVKAVPRMEAFLKSVAATIFPDHPNPPLDQLIPEILKLQSNPLINSLKSMLRPNLELVSDQELVEKFKILLENSSKAASKSDYDTQRDRCFEYLHKLFQSNNDNKLLLERINHCVAMTRKINNNQ